MDTLATREDPDVDEHLLDGLGLRSESLLSQQLHFHFLEERLHRRVLLHVAISAILGESATMIVTNRYFSRAVSSRQAINRLIRRRPCRRPI